MKNQKIERTLVIDCLERIQDSVTVQGWVHAVRSHGKIAFLDLIDRTGIIQVGAFGAEMARKVAGLSQQDVISVTGIVKKREERYINNNSPTGSIEIEAQTLEILSKADTMPFDMAAKDLHLELPTLLDYRSLTLRHEQVREIFKIQAAILAGFREAAEKIDCIEIVVPTIAASSTEGGAEVFKVDYYGHNAFMTQSPQLYKQIMVGVFERVFTIAKAYRAEPSVTTRHLAEATQMDIEIGFVTFEELLNALEFVGIYIIKTVSGKHPQILEDLKIEKPIAPAKIPRLTLRQAQRIVMDRTGRDLSREPDLNPEDEIEICKWARAVHQSDFVTITHFPTKKRAFYTMPYSDDPEYSLSYDLLFRGLEILSGSQRINDYDKLVDAIKSRGMDPENFQIYLQAFKYGMPPEGGFSFGLERLTMKFLELANVRQASLFPRDMERVDERFTKNAQKTSKQ